MIELKQLSFGSFSSTTYYVLSVIFEPAVFARVYRKHGGA
jgi:hypothetical protein